MDTNNLLRIIDNDKLNFIAQCGSVMQMNCINSAIYYLEAKGVKINGVVLLCTSETLSIKDYERNYFVRRENLKYIVIEGGIDYYNWFEKIDVFRRSFFLNRKQDAVFFVSVCLLHPIVYVIQKLGRRVIYVEINDGIQNYFNRYKVFMISDFAGKKYPPHIMIYKYFRRVMTEVSYYVLDLMIRRKKSYIDALIIRKKSKKENEKFIKCFHLYLKENGKNLVYDNIKELEDSILIVGTGSEDIFFLKELVRRMVDKNYKVVFKPHPREKRIEQYLDLGCMVFQDESISLETIIERLGIKPRCIIGAHCATLVTCKILFGIPTISFVHLINDNLVFEKISKLFFDEFKGIVLFPKSIKQLIDILSYKQLCKNEDMRT